MDPKAFDPWISFDNVNQLVYDEIGFPLKCTNKKSKHVWEIGLKRR